MKCTAILLVFVGAILFLAQDSLLARGGGGGGRGGGGGGGARAGGGGGMSAAAGRSPAMGAGAAARPAAGGGAAARPAVRPAGSVGGAARPGTGAGGPGTNAGVGARPSAGQLNNFLDIPLASTGAVGAGGGVRPGAGGAAADFLQGGGGAAASQLPSRTGAGAAAAARPGVAAGVGAGAAGARAQNLSTNRASRIENRQELQGNRQQRSDEVRNQVAENHPRLDFWSNYPGWAARRITRPYRWATWGALGGWLGYGSGEPTSYAYGEDIYYEGDQVYQGDQPVATADQYAQQAETIAAGAEQAKPENGEWLPLGVFALTQDNQATGVEPTIFMQLAIAKDGVISGTLKNTATDQVQTLEGMADKKSQRVAWGVKDQKWPIMETGLSNLTRDTSPALIHFADGQTQQWLLVRLPEPKQG
jgi:hypothetical protein